MRVRYRLDTDWVIHHLHDNPKVVEQLDKTRGEGIALPVVPLGELHEGVFYSLDPEGSEKNLTEFLRGVVIIELDDAVSRVFGRERGRLRQLKRTIGDFDLLIAAAALRHNLTLLTNNRRHLEVIDGLSVKSM